jgi:hypothetical protein
MLKIYNEYQKHGIENYYKSYSSSYINPHQNKIKKLYNLYLNDMVSRNDTILDIACGDGLLMKIINEQNKDNIIEGTDPFFSNKYCTYNFSFEDIALGKFDIVNKKYNLAFCCYAFHLINESWKYDFLSQLTKITNKFIIITPSKKITINHPFWKLVKCIREDKITIIILETIHQTFY